jgi:hypothetical protein
MRIGNSRIDFRRGLAPIPMLPRFMPRMVGVGVGAMGWLVSVASGVAVLAITSALAFGMIWSVERLAERGVRFHQWRMTSWFHGWGGRR